MHDMVSPVPTPVADGGSAANPTPRKTRRALLKRWFGAISLPLGIQRRCRCAEWLKERAQWTAHGSVKPLRVPPSYPRPQPLLPLPAPLWLPGVSVKQPTAILGLAAKSPRTHVRDMSYHAQSFWEQRSADELASKAPHVDW